MLMLTTKVEVIFGFLQNISLKVIKQKLYSSEPAFAHKTKHSLPQNYRTLKENKDFVFPKIHPYNNIIIKGKSVL